MSNCLQVSDPEFFELGSRNEGHKLPGSMWDSKWITTKGNRIEGECLLENDMNKNYQCFVQQGSVCLLAKGGMWRRSRVGWVRTPCHWVSAGILG